MTDTPTPQSPPPTPPQRPLEDLTLAELAGALWRAPRETWRGLTQITRAGRRASAGVTYAPRAWAVEHPDDHPAPRAPSAWGAHLNAHRYDALRLGVYTLALIFAWLSNILLTPRVPESPLRIAYVPFSAGVFPLVLALVACVGVEVFIRRQSARENLPQSTPISPPLMASPSARLSGLRWVPLALGATFAVGAYALNGGNSFTLPGVIAWVLGAGWLIYAFLPPVPFVDRPSMGAWARLKTFTREHQGVVLALIVITLFGAVFRFQGLESTPPEMTSDHIEKLIDAQAVSEGRFNVFFQGNGGREPLQMYLIALLGSAPGMEINFWNMKVVAALEGVLTIPVFFWLGVTIMGGGLLPDLPARDRRKVYLFGLTLALILAVAYWHVAVGRVSLRIILTPLVSAVLLTFLIRAMRHNRRSDFVWAGLVLGAGLYTYQAVRMLPLVAIAAVALAILFYAKTWAQRRTYAANFVVLVVVAFALFMPMFRFSVEYPQDFWRRSAGRLLGDDLIQVTLEDGTVIERDVTSAERLEALRRNAEIFGQNMLDAVLMFTYRGDVIYLHNAPNYPAMSPFMGALLLVGAGAWLVRVYQRRDPADALIFAGLLIMLLPSALSIASPNENPSHTRTSGAMPMAVLLAAYGLYVWVMMVRRLIPSAAQTARLIVSTGMIAVIGLGIYSTDSAWVLEAYRQNYIQAWKPLSDGGRLLRGFAESDGAYGNAFMLAYPHWWDYRIVANEAGLPPGKWTNGDIALEQIPYRIAGGYFAQPESVIHLDTERDLIFMYPDEHPDAYSTLTEWFPDGRETRIPTYKEGTYYRVYRVPALGQEGVRDFLRRFDIPVD